MVVKSKLNPPPPHTYATHPTPPTCCVFLPFCQLVSVLDASRRMDGSGAPEAVQGAEVRATGAGSDPSRGRRCKLRKDRTRWLARRACRRALWTNCSTRSKPARSSGMRKSRLAQTKFEHYTVLVGADPPQESFDQADELPSGRSRGQAFGCVDTSAHCV